MVWVRERVLWTGTSIMRVWRWQGTGITKKNGILDGDDSACRILFRALMTFLSSLMFDS